MTLDLQETEPSELAVAHLFALRMKLTTFSSQPARASCTCNCVSFRASGPCPEKTRRTKQVKKKLSYLNAIGPREESMVHDL